MSESTGAFAPFLRSLNEAKRADYERFANQYRSTLGSAAVLYEVSSFEEDAIQQGSVHPSDVRERVRTLHEVLTDLDKLLSTAQDLADDNESNELIAKLRSIEESMLLNLDMRPEDLRELRKTLKDLNQHFRSTLL